MKNSFWKTLIAWGILLAIVLLISEQLGNKTRPIKISYTEFWEQVKLGNVKDVQITDRTITGTFLNPYGGHTEFKTEMPFDDPDAVDRLVKAGVKVVAKPRSIWIDLIVTFVPWILIFALLWFFMVRQMRGGGGGVMDFTRSRVKIIKENKPDVTFDDVADIEEAKEELKEVVEFLKNPGKFRRVGARIPKGVLLVGPPGTGKTLLARAVAGEAGVPFLSISGSDFVELFVGVGAARVRDLFRQARENSPCIIFIDELDAVGRLRGAGIGGGHDEREQTLNQLLVEMDGFDPSEGIIVMAATNRPDILDPALLRPGRFDKRVVVGLPDVRGREQILKLHARKLKLADDVDLAAIAKGTPGFSGADLENLVNEAALNAARNNREIVTMQDFEEARDKLIMGAARKSLILSDEEKRITAYHEAGHALVAKILPDPDPIHKVTIIPRGTALGATTQLPLDDRHNYSKDYIMKKLAVLLGGRAAEKEALGIETIGAANDIEKATEIARKMVSEWGMSEKLGPVALGKVEEEVFIGRELGVKRPYSEATARIIDEEIKRFVNDAYQTALEIVRNNREILEAIVEELLQKETITGEDIDRIIQRFKGEQENAEG